MPLDFILRKQQQQQQQQRQRHRSSTDIGRGVVGARSAIKRPQQVVDFAVMDLCRTHNR